MEVAGLTVQAGSRALLQNAEATFQAVEVTLLLGCSGVGKSVLLRILAGLIDESTPGIQFTGSVKFHRDSSSSKIAEQRSVAVVFQNFALLDELSPLQNVQVALDHTGISSSPDRAIRLLSELGVPTDRPVSVLSGGQQQRLAIARAIAPESDVVLYDEPTSGLDTRTGHQVADLIRETHERHRRTSIIVTHDYQALTRIADRIILLDHQKQQLREIPRSEWDHIGESLSNPPSSDGDVPAGNLKDLLRRFADGVFTSTGQFAEELVLIPSTLLPLWKSVRWGLRYTGYYLRLVAGPSACVYIAIAGMILGFVSQDFIFRYLPFRQFTEPLLTENLLHGTGFSLFRFLVPILATILIAARSGAAVASDVGSKVYGNQLDAMKTLGMSPTRLLKTPILYAFLIGTPFLTMLSYAVAAATAAVAFLMTHGELGIAFWDAHFHQQLRQPDSWLYKGSGWLITKLLCCGTGIALISWQHGSARKMSGSEISHGVTRTILWATLYVLFIHFAFSLYEFQPQK